MQFVDDEEEEGENNQEGQDRGETNEEGPVPAEDEEDDDTEDDEDNDDFRGAKEEPKGEVNSDNQPLHHQPTEKQQKLPEKKGEKHQLSSINMVWVFYFGRKFQVR